MIFTRDQEAIAWSWPVIFIRDMQNEISTLSLCYVTFLAVCTKHDENESCKSVIPTILKSVPSNHEFYGGKANGKKCHRETNNNPNFRGKRSEHIPLEVVGLGRLNDDVGSVMYKYSITMSRCTTIVINYIKMFSQQHTLFERTVYSLSSPGIPQACFSDVGKFFNISGRSPRRGCQTT